jgi:hypothetical protein
MIFIYFKRKEVRHPITWQAKMPFISKSGLYLQSLSDSVAQLVEQLTLNQWVHGSSPCGVTMAQ